VKEAEYSKFIGACSGEVLETLEYLDKDEFEHFINMKMLIN